MPLAETNGVYTVPNAETVPAAASAVAFLASIGLNVHVYGYSWQVLLAFILKTKLQQCVRTATK